MTLLWSPPDDVRETTEIGRYLTWLERERGLRHDDYDAFWRWSVSDLEGFWSSIWEFFGVRAHAPYEQVIDEVRMPGARWFAGARLNYAEHLLGTDDDLDDDGRRRALADAGAARADLRRPARGGGARSRRPAAPGRRPRRPRRRLPPEHPRDADRVRRDREPGGDVGVVRARVRRPQRHRPLRADRAEGAARRVRLRLPRQARRPARAGGGDQGRAAEPRARGPRPYGPDSAARGDRLGRAARRGRAAGVRLRRVRPPAVRAVLLGHHGAAEGDRPRSRRHAARAPQDAVARLGPGAGRAPAVVHDDGLDDVERARLGAAHARVDRDDRRRPGVAGPVVPVGARAGDAADADGGQPRVPDGLPQGRASSRGGASTSRASASSAPPARRCPPRAIATSTSSSGARCCCSTAAAAPTSAPGSSPAASSSRSGRARSPAARRAARSQAFDADGEPVVGELGELVITKPMPSMPVRFWNDPGGERYRDAYFAMYPGVWRQGDWVRFTERGSCVITGRSDATLNRGGVRLGTSELYAVVHGHARGRRQPRRPPRGRRGRGGRAAAVRRARRRRPARRRPARADRRRPARRALAAPRARPHRRRARRSPRR